MAHSPVFIATFNDDTQTRMTVWHDPEHKTLNLDRGIRLARHAYRSRRGQEPPLIVAARFECDGEISCQLYRVRARGRHRGRAYGWGHPRTCGIVNSTATAARRGGVNRPGRRLAGRRPFHFVSLLARGEIEK